MSPYFNLLKCRRLGTAATSQMQSALVRPPPALIGRRSVRRRAPTTLQTAGRLPGHRGNNYSNCEPMLRGAPRRSERRSRRGPEREEEDTGSLTRAWLSRPRPCQPPLRNPNEEVEGRGSLTRTALAAAVGCVDSLISGRQARSRPTTGGRLRVQPVPCLPPALGNYLLTTRCPSPANERMRDDARARGWSGVGTGSTSRQGTERKEEVEGRGSLTRIALAAAVRRVDSLISGRQARSVRSTPTWVTDACRLDPVGVHQRPTTGGRLRVQLELCLLPPPVEHQHLRRMLPSTRRLRLRYDRARPRVGRRLGSGTMSINDPPDTDHYHLSRRGRVPDEKTPGHEATISPPSRTCTLKSEGVEDPRARAAR
ncbi:hypothetical protein EVAR_9575_1 [Eumeta japonica]|uniref:Uncharacterized protein n=1 Tax=Eumeta variegata TaxID=151549 RepID=A0A4C1TJH1_EUMVA|nr:hypothetical protein EVAR_9575_1 [Eumeta japonica]